MKRKTKKIKTLSGIAKIYPIDLGGYKQWLLMRGENKDNPILLFLHGGPGMSNIGIAAATQSVLEHNFVVVNWDQLGGGLSYYKNIPQCDMTIEKMVGYTVEIIRYLLTEFNKDKVYLVGHSWGSILGIIVASKFPELVERYIGVSQVVDGALNEEYAYNFCYEFATKNNVEKALRQLESIGKPPYGNWSKGLQIRSKWSAKFHAMSYSMNVQTFYLSKMLKSKEYKLFDIFKFMSGFGLSLNNIWREVMELDLNKCIEKLAVESHFFLGKHDYQAPFILAEKFVAALKAPVKEVVWFDNSAHMSIIEESEKIQNEIVKLLK